MGRSDLLVQCTPTAARLSQSVTDSYGYEHKSVKGASWVLKRRCSDRADEPQDGILPLNPFSKASRTDFHA